MGKNPAKWPRRSRWLLTLHDPGPPRLWRIGWALASCFGVAVLGLVGLSFAAKALLHYPQLPRPAVISLHDTVGVLQLVFASVAGTGALVALVMAYRRQRVAETTSALDRDRFEPSSAHDRTRLLNERFTTIAGQFGDSNPVVRLAGVHAMAGLADDWKENRQTCVDVLCAYLRLPYEPDPGNDPAAAEQLAFRASREVRHTVIRVIAAHLREDAATSWQGLDFDFTGVVFDGGNFRNAEFSGGRVDFRNAEFSGGKVDFGGAEFSGGSVSFDGAKFSGGKVDFMQARFSGGEVDFSNASISDGKVNFGGGKFSGGLADFTFCEFSGGSVNFGGAEFSGGNAYFVFSKFPGSEVSFSGAQFSGGLVSFSGAGFSGGRVSFDTADFSGGTVLFGGAEFSGGTVDFSSAQFSGGTVDFSKSRNWSHPPTFSFTGTPPAGVILQAAAEGTVAQSSSRSGR